MSGLWTLCILWTVLAYSTASDSKEQRLSNVVAVVGRHFTYHLPEDSNLKSTRYSVREEGKKSLPKWLSYDQDKNLLYGVPSWRDKGTYHLELQTTKTRPFIVYVKDLHDVASDLKLRNSNLTKIPSYKEIVCHSGLPVAAATMIFDLHAGKLGGKERAALLQRVAAFADIDVSNLHMSLGKGHSTALNLKDVMMLTAGPGNVHEAKEPGIVVSWQIGCGIDVAGTRTASLLKSSAETGAFDKALSSPVSGWHITTGFPKGPRRRTRRQVQISLKPTPTPSRKPAVPPGKLPLLTATPTMVVTPPTTQITKATISISSPTLVPTVTPVPNTPPVVRSNFSPITLFSGQMLEFTIPDGTFYDAQDGYTRALSLKMYSMSGATLASSNWVILDESSQVIYALGLSPNIGTHQFLVSASDSKGASIQTPLTIQVQQDTHQYNHIFSLYLNIDANVLSNNVELRVQLLNLLARYFGVAPSDVRAVSVETGSPSGSVFKFHFAHVPYQPCPNNPTLQQLIDQFGKKSVNPRLVSTLGSRYAMTGGSYKLIGDCSNKPVVNKPIGQIDSVAGQAFEVSLPKDIFTDVEDGYNLQLDLRTQGLANLQPSSPILFHKTQRKIYGLPMDDMIGQFKYNLQATDSDNNIGKDEFSFNVKPDTNKYNHEFTIVLNTDQVEFTSNVDKRLKLLEEIAAYFQTGVGDVRVVNFGPGVTFTFRFSDVPYDDCRGRLRTLINDFGEKKDEINPSFKRALTVPITKGMYTLLGPCKVDTEPPRCDKRISVPAVFSGQQFEHLIPSDTCVDQVDGDISKLNLDLRALGDIVLASNSWVQLDGNTHTIFGLATDKQIGDNELTLIVKDRSGLSDKETFTIPVKRDNFPYNHVFNIVLEVDKVKFDNVAMQIEFVKKLASYFGVNPNDVRVSLMKDGKGPKEIDFSFHLANIPEKQCDSKELASAVSAFGKKAPTNTFINSLKSKFVVKSGNVELLGICAVNEKPKVDKGIVPGGQPIRTIGGQATYHNIPADAFIDAEDGDTRKLKLQLLTPDGKPVPSDSWVKLDTSTQEIQALPLGAQAAIKNNNFIIKAFDSKGASVNNSFTIEVDEDLTNYTMMFKLLLDYPDVKVFSDDVKERLELINALANHFKLNKDDIRVISTKGAEFNFYISSTATITCNDQRRVDQVNSFGRNKKVLKALRKSLEPRFKAKEADVDMLGPCRPLGNDRPYVNVPLGTKELVAGTPFIINIPYDTFLDNQEFNTKNLKLKFTQRDGSPLPKTSWVVLTDKQQFVGLPDLDVVGEHDFNLMAVDSLGAAETDLFKINVNKPTQTISTEFIMFLKTPKKQFMNDVLVRFSLTKKLADFFEVPLSKINVLSYGPDGSNIKFKFGLTNLPNQPCDHDEILKAVKKFGIQSPTRELKDFIGKEFNVKASKVEQVGTCDSTYNNKPIVRNEFDRLNLFHNQGLRFLIPVDAYDDMEDGSTRKLTLTLRLEGHKDKSLLPTSWILMNSTSQEIYALPMSEFAGIHTFVIEVKDSGGKMSYDSFEVLVKEDTAPFNHKFTIFLNNNNATFLNNVGVRLGLVQKLADYFGVNLTNVRVDDYGPGPYMTFHLDNIPIDDCTSNYIDMFGAEKINPKLKAFLAPEYGLVDGSYFLREPCGGYVDAVAVKPSTARGAWWSPTLIPVIVVGILLLLLGLCLMFVLRRKHKQGLSGDDRSTFIYKRKPVVFKEEYDVKEDLLKQPLVLPNEKPPLPPPAYPRTPNGSAVTTPMMGDERRAYQAPSFTSSRQMSSSSSSNAMTASGGGGGGGAAMSGGAGSAGAAGMSGGGMAGAGAGAGGGGAGAGGAGGGGFAGSAGGASMSEGGGAGEGGAGAGGAAGGGGGGGGGMNASKSSSYSYSSSSQSSSARKGAYSGYRLPPAYVPP